MITFPVEFEQEAKWPKLWWPKHLFWQLCFPKWKRQNDRGRAWPGFLILPSPNSHLQVDFLTFNLRGVLRSHLAYWESCLSKYGRHFPSPSVLSKQQDRPLFKHILPLNRNGKEESFISLFSMPEMEVWNQDKNLVARCWHFPDISNETQIPLTVKTCKKCGAKTDKIPGFKMSTILASFYP